MTLRAAILVGVCAVSAAVGAAVTLTDPAPTEPRWVIAELGPLGRQSEAEAINKRGAIIGIAFTGSGSWHAYLWTRGRSIDLGTLGGTQSSSPTAINERGQVVGYSTARNGTFRGFLWNHGRLIDLGTLGGSEASAEDVNERGQVVGWSTTRSGARHAFVWQNGKMIDLGTGQAVAINDHGQIVGFRRQDPRLPGLTHAVLWRSGKTIDLGTLGGKISQAMAINERGQIFGISTTPISTQGWHGFLWEHGHMTDVDATGRTQLDGGTITETGQVIGWGEAANTAWTHAFLWQTGTIVDLGPPGHDSYALGINKRDQIVGRVDGAGDRFGREKRHSAYLWQDGHMTRLPTLDGRQGLATAINDRGEIVGFSTTKDGQRHAVTWTLRAA